jgi:hypothetical protein
MKSSYCSDTFMIRFCRSTHLEPLRSSRISGASGEVNLSVNVPMKI